MQEQPRRTSSLKRKVSVATSTCLDRLGGRCSSHNSCHLPTYCHSQHPEILQVPISPNSAGRYLAHWNCNPSSSAAASDHQTRFLPILARITSQPNFFPNTLRDSNASSSEYRVLPRTAPRIYSTSIATPPSKLFHLDAKYRYYPYPLSRHLSTDDRRQP